MPKDALNDDHLSLSGVAFNQIESSFEISHTWTYPLKSTLMIIFLINHPLILVQLLSILLSLAKLIVMIWKVLL